ncbi:MAG: hypothetical protein NZ927_06100 [Candidatus Calescibacterium sp.]|nr:hypothetical protein [Candidatus Calescibacterium sp.]MCX7734322.1 hypothetical protein [bacterium]MDW8087593.1 hypothetical protein [Candidatus Calescibacterium sp.]
MLNCHKTSKNRINNSEIGKRIIAISIFLSLSIFFSGTGVVNSSSGEIYIVINSSLGNISLEDIKKAYRGEISKIQGKDIVLYELPLDNPAKKVFIEKFLGLDLESYRKIWLVKLMGGGSIPKVAKEDEIIKNVSAQDNAIGYIQRAVQSDNIKVISIK